ncbi:uncharacterized protein BDZ99DRAFT_520010 [Mytilinidion resinicola]|uniref:F-box domain-containing protein n=1 Tax=Mytilinidion resinicola TaxID=574789 RepID=A0A6A6YMA7_9PEZI|nr:uncharacterized protein BDZ99DRAFT_520010 [Mytilinidion resinicola]KAF2809911.1 hypothetical protein BDZ99DRAFT_520010 [Mytilinidion resinicola]
MTHSPLYQLPLELLFLVSEYLSPPALLVLRLTCTRFSILFKLPEKRLWSLSDKHEVKTVLHHEQYKYLCKAEHQRRIHLLHYNYVCSHCKDTHLTRAFLARPTRPGPQEPYLSRGPSHLWDIAAHGLVPIFPRPGTSWSLGS